MSNLTIPERYRRGLLKLLSLADPDLDQLVEALQSAPISANLEEIREAVARHVSVITPQDLGEIVKALFSLYVVRAQSEVSLNRFAADIMEALQEIDLPPNIRSEDDVAAKTRRALQRVLEIEPLNLVSKAIGLQGEHARTFCDARVLTDLRPVFSSDPAASPVGMVITHTLKVEYHEGGDHREFFIALDADDIKTLSEVLARAGAKAASLDGLLVGCGIRNLDFSR